MYKKIQKTIFFTLMTLFMSMTLSSCGENGIFSKNSNSNAADGSSQWPPSLFPLKVGISNQFSSPEQQGMQDIGNEWTKAHGREQFFNFETISGKSVSHLEDYNDSTLGVYKMEQMLPGYPEGSALAVTQVYADRVNYGGKSYFNIKHADIIVNYADYRFSSGESFGSYDLKTVILHELGHFLGLGHFNEAGQASIMEPSIDTFDQIHSPYEVDRQLVRNNYPTTREDQESQTSALRSIASLTSRSQNMPVTQVIDTHDAQKPEIEVIEKNVRIVHQLHANKSCDHYIDGKKVFTHKVK